jgi:hypothetical protein
MKCYGQERTKGYWIKRAIFIPIAIAAGIFVFGFAVMYLWNGILTPVLGVGIITFWQAIGILILSKILFGCFKGGHSHHKYHGHHIKEKMMQLSPEEREKMYAEYKERCCNTKKED